MRGCGRDPERQASIIDSMNNVLRLSSRAFGALLVACALAVAGPSGARAGTDGWSDVVARVERALAAADKGLDRFSMTSLTSDLERLLRIQSESGAAPIDQVRFPDLYRLAARARAEGRAGPRLEAFVDAVRHLDLALYRANDALARPSTRWIRTYVRVQDPPRELIDDGAIAYASRSTCLDVAGEERAGGGCERIAFDRFDLRIPGVAPREVLHWVEELPAEVVNDRIREAFEVDLGEGRISRSQKTIDFYLSNGSMELYRVRERVADEEIIIREENARSGKFVQRSDGIVRILTDGRNGSYYSLVGTAETVFGSDFLGDKRAQETVRSLAILRQYVLLRDEGVEPGRAAREARDRGNREWRDVQLAAADLARPSGL